MHTYRIPGIALEVSRIAYGCMNIGGAWNTSPLSDERRLGAARAVHAAVDQGITLFDHADIYCRGKSEEAFGAVLRSSPGLRAKIVLQSKCGIRVAGDPEPGLPGRYDFSADHILRSVEGSLRRLGAESLDLLLLHRPDPLAEPEEVARAFDALYASGRVRAFGVSNHTRGQIELLRSAVDQPLVVNQVELSLLHHHLINEGIIADRDEPGAPRAEGTLDYCRREQILVQAWAPVAGGRLLDPPAGADGRVRAAADLVAQMAAGKRTSKEAIVLAWILRHPAHIQPIIGTTKPERIAASCLADGVELSREEWYALFTAARGSKVP